MALRLTTLSGRWLQQELKPLEASLSCTAAIACSLGLTAWFYLRPGAGEQLSDARRLPRLGQGSCIWSCGGDAWRYKSLHLRSEAYDLSFLDCFAGRIAGRWAPSCEVVRLHPSAADVLGLKTQEPLWCLRVDDGLPEKQGVVTVEVQPGCGLLELYGQPGLYHMQDESLLRAGELAKGGRFSAVDLFSGRQARALRALEALASSPDGKLQVLVDEGESTFAKAAEVLKLEGATSLLSMVAELLDSRSDSAGLLPGILRAQCAGDPLNESCQQLLDILRLHHGAWRPTVQDLEAAMKRGYWSLPADQSGMHLREREAERLLDRAKREMWQDGSASRLELEKQIKRFLCLHLLGSAACRARLRFQLVRADDTLARLRFAPLQGAPEIWYRVELAPLHLKPP